ncbi:hypothetical protein EF912_27885 [Streptomyces sp. WAC07061]|uniref:hypothetical protein n=1 Tax=Streptomyces sp. WAC07061 TaxID=2487410 RepID=UPI000F789805|nr:hypothetical protein [Streptomyces sp. WAC07061]RSS46000.1 hypothetical protein EF912_27885 [Streptomyces sp. WAC07061]
MITMKRALGIALAGAFLGTSGAAYAADTDTVFTLSANGPRVSQHYLKAIPHAQSSTVTHVMFVPPDEGSGSWAGFHSGGSREGEALGLPDNAASPKLVWPSRAADSPEFP